MAAAEHLRVAVLGPGAIGGLLGALLARSGNSVLLLASDSTSRALAENGLRVESRRFGDFLVPVQTSLLLETPVDVCLITVKATQLRQALERIPQDAVAKALLIPFLNGIEHVELLRSLYPRSTVAAATIRVEAVRVAPGFIRQISPFAQVELAATGDQQERVKLFGSQLEAAGLDVRLRDDENAMLWDKLALLAPLALLTTHERSNAGAIRTRRREDLIAVISEVAAVARAEGAAVDPEVVVGFMDAAPDTMESSMQRDQAAGRQLELDAIGGAVLRRAERLGIAAPVTARIVGEIAARNTAQRSERAPGVSGG